MVAVKLRNPWDASGKAGEENMANRQLVIFREYVQSLPHTLLQQVTQDYVWLASLSFLPLERKIDFRARRECCRVECARRDGLQLDKGIEDWAARQS